MWYNTTDRIAIGGLGEIPGLFSHGAADALHERVGLFFSLLCAGERSPFPTEGRWNRSRTIYMEQSRWSARREAGPSRFNTGLLCQLLFTREVVTVAVDWLAIRNDYINGGGSYRKLAEKYGVNKDSIATKAKAEDWKGQREAQADKTQTKSIQKTEEKISDALSDEVALKVKLRTGLLKMAVEWVVGHEKITNTGDFRRMVQSCIDLGIMDANTEGDIEDDSLLAALGANAQSLFDDGDDSNMLPKEKEQ